MEANCDTIAPRTGSVVSARGTYHGPVEQCRRLHFGLVKGSSSLRVGDPKEGLIAQESLSI
jgi:hypothetical protein